MLLTSIIIAFTLLTVFLIMRKVNRDRTRADEAVLTAFRSIPSAPFQMTRMQLIMRCTSHDLSDRDISRAVTRLTKCGHLRADNVRAESAYMLASASSMGVS